MAEQKVPKIADLYDLEHTIAAPLLEGKDYPWEALDGIKEFILQLGPTLDPELYDNPAEGVEGIPQRLSGQPLHHRLRSGSAPLRVYPRFRHRGQERCGRKFRGAEERRAVR